VIVELLIFLQARGVEFAAAVTLGMLFGPARSEPARSKACSDGTTIRSGR
jgi:hypothetical protein